MSLFVLTGWILSSGQPVFFSKSGQYLPDWTQAQIFEDESILNQAKIDAQSGKVVDPYLIEVLPIANTQDEMQYLPVKQKEQIRLKGPTVKINNRIKDVSL
jgi:hypothetical protein